MNKMILEILLIIAAVPLGLLIAWLVKDELVAGKIYFIAIMSLSALLAFAAYYYNKIPESLSLVFVFIVALVALVKSGDKSWTR